MCKPNSSFIYVVVPVGCETGYCAFLGLASIFIGCCSGLACDINTKCITEGATDSEDLRILTWYCPPFSWG